MVGARVCLCVLCAVCLRIYIIWFTKNKMIELTFWMLMWIEKVSFLHSSEPLIILTANRFTRTACTTYTHTHSRIWYLSTLVSTDFQANLTHFRWCPQINERKGKNGQTERGIQNLMLFEAWTVHVTQMTYVYTSTLNNPRGCEHGYQNIYIRCRCHLHPFSLITRDHILNIIWCDDQRLSGYVIVSSDGDR